MLFSLQDIVGCVFINYMCYQVIVHIPTRSKTWCLLFLKYTLCFVYYTCLKYNLLNIFLSMFELTFMADF